MVKRLGKQKKMELFPPMNCKTIFMGNLDTMICLILYNCIINHSYNYIAIKNRENMLYMWFSYFFC